jgi:hypothetical protein
MKTEACRRHAAGFFQKERNIENKLLTQMNTESLSRMRQVLFFMVTGTERAA